jgi:hypothetical protein
MVSIRPDGRWSREAHVHPPSRCLKVRYWPPSCEQAVIALCSYLIGRQDLLRAHYSDCHKHTPKSCCDRSYHPESKSEGVTQGRYTRAGRDRDKPIRPEGGRLIRNLQVSLCYDTKGIYHGENEGTARFQVQLGARGQLRLPHRLATCVTNLPKVACDRSIAPLTSPCEPVYLAKMISLCG